MDGTISRISGCGGSGREKTFIDAQERLLQQDSYHRQQRWGCHLRPGTSTASWQNDQGDDKVIKNGAFPIKLIVENLQTDEIFQQCDLMAVWWHPHGNCKRQRGVLQWQYIVHSKKNPKYSYRKIKKKILDFSTYKTLKKVWEIKKFIVQSKKK